MFRNIFNTFVNCFKIPELKSRILFTMGLLAICRLMTWIRIPNLNGAALTAYFSQNSQSGGGLLGMYNTFAGGASERCAVGALGIMPYISATIIIQLLTAVWPKLSKLAREENGRTKIVQYGRYLTVLLCLGQGLFFAVGWEHPQNIFHGFQGNLVFDSTHIWWYRIQTVLIMTTGTMLLILLVLVVGGVIAITQAQRKVPVQYAQRAVGRKMYSGGTSFMPLRVNYSGVMPIIFAQSILMFPQTIFLHLGNMVGVPFLKNLFIGIAQRLNSGSVLYLVIYSLMILFFAYFWVATQFNELQIADDLKKNGGYIPGVRPGQGTSDYLHKSMSRITLAGAIFLMVIATIPIILSRQMNIPYDVAQFFGGTSILITVGVLLDTMRQVESHLMMRHYDGFLKRGKLRGRF